MFSGVTDGSYHQQEDQWLKQFENTRKSGKKEPDNKVIEWPTEQALPPGWRAPKAQHSSQLATLILLKQG